MARDDHIDRTALTFVILTLIFLVTLGYIIFPRHDAPSAPPSTSGSGSSSPGTAPAAAPQKK